MRDTSYKPKPGDLILTQIDGWVGRLLCLLQQVIARDPSEFTHVAVVLDDGKVIAGQPGGARIDTLAGLLSSGPVAFVPVPSWAEHLRPLIVSIARSYEGTPYGYTSYLWLGLSSFNLRPKWLRRLVASEKTMQCASLADRVWTRAGIHLFKDGRPLGDVTPGDIHGVGWIFNYNSGPYKS